MPLLAHAFHDAAALGVPPASLAVAGAAILTVAVVLPARADEPRLLLPDDGPRSAVDGEVGAREADRATVRTRTRGTVRTTARAGALALLAVVVLLVGVLGPATPNLAALLVGSLALPVTVVTAAVFGGPGRAVPASRRGRDVAADRPVPRAAAPALAVVLHLAWTAGALGGRSTAVLAAGYLAATTIGRWRCGPRWWRDGDAVVVLARAVGRLAPADRGPGGRRRRPWAAGLLEPLDPAERAVVTVVVAAGLARAAAFLSWWAPLTVGRGGAALVLRDLTLLALAVAALTVGDRLLRPRGVRVSTAALVPVAVALVVANHAAPAIFGVQLGGVLVSDPFATGADLFGTAGARVGVGVLTSPLTWLSQLVVVLLGGIVGATAQRDLDRRDGVTGRGAPAAVAAVAGTALLVLTVS